MFPAESTITAPTWHKPNVSQLVPGEAKTWVRHGAEYYPATADNAKKPQKHYSHKRSLQVWLHLYEMCRINLIPYMKPSKTHKRSEEMAQAGEMGKDKILWLYKVIPLRTMGRTQWKFSNLEIHT
jgi:hypothetical protein